MQEALDLFHANKDIFIDEGIHEHFNISKLHSLIHYVDSITLFGSLDGFNSKHPERLHIDYAKRGYRASNKRDYTIQMTRWLQCQEAIDLCTAYLQWLDWLDSLLHHSLDVRIEADKDIGLLDRHSGTVEPVEDCDNSDAEYDYEVGQADVAPLFSYKTAKKPSNPSTAVTRLTSAYGATEFLPALQTFLDHNIPHDIHGASQTLKPNQFDCFDIYNTVSILLPSKPHVSDTKHLITLQATPEHSNGPRKLPTPAHFDTAVIIEDEEAYEEGQIAGMSN
jgi:hypothetical protein